MTQAIRNKIANQLQNPSRLTEVTTCYLLSLIMEARQHTLTNAATLFNVSLERYSKLLSNHKELALENLNRQARRRLKRLLKKHKSLTASSKWKVAIIIDATFHERSSRHVENSQRFNHGEGWVVGHQ